MADLRERFSWFAVIGCSILLASGCGGPNLGSPTTVSGTVTVDGEPLAGAPLAFHAMGGEVPAEHRTFTATTDGSGRYKIDRIYPGTYEVMVIEGGAGAGDEVQATNPLQPAEGDELRVQIGAEPAVYDIKLTRR